MLAENAEQGSRHYVEELWKDEMAAVLLAYETSFETVKVRLNNSGYTYTMLVADTAERRKVGLSFRSELPEGIDGMLFVHPDEAIRSFTADRTRMNLHLYSFDSAGRLQGEHFLPKEDPGPFVCTKNQYTIETCKDIEVEFLELA